MRRSGTNILQAASYVGRHEWKQHCADLSYLLAEFLEIRAYWDEAIAAHSLALRAGRYLADPARVARAARALSVVCQQTGRHDTATPLAEEDRSDLPVARRSPGEAESLDQIGLAHQRTARSLRHSPASGTDLVRCGRRSAGWPAP